MKRTERVAVGSNYFASGSVNSELAGEGLVQERLLQRLQRGEFSLVEAGEALGFF
ncbi:MAG: hypothetical protein IPP19_11335 [Verrucomicrobia bacterium]|nr:hypothetical protein [Verrucomicrobiota bacterium]